MPERKRSRDGGRDSDRVDTSRAGRAGASGGDKARDIGSRDEQKRAERGEGLTREKKLDEKPSAKRDKHGG